MALLNENNLAADAGRRARFRVHHVGTKLGTGLQRAVVEQAIKAQVQETAAGASSTGSFWGKVVVNGQQVFYRAYTLANGAINIGTYTVGAP
jgi:xanthine dehydrogenase molybdopterin-binding subunit B